MHSEIWHSWISSTETKFMDQTLVITDQKITIWRKKGHKKRLAAAKLCLDSRMILFECVRGGVKMSWIVLFWISKQWQPLRLRLFFPWVNFSINKVGFNKAVIVCTYDPPHFLLFWILYPFVISFFPHLPQYGIELLGLYYFSAIFADFGQFTWIKENVLVPVRYYFKRTV